MEDFYMAIDLKCFFASVECLRRGLDIFTTPLVVADVSRGEGSVTLATTPYLKNQGVKARCRIFEIPRNLRDKIIYAKPHMADYVAKSREIMDIYLDFFSKEDILVYSIDEVFIRLTPYLDLYRRTAKDLANQVKDEVYRRSGIHSSVGVSYSMVMAKLAMDLDSKKEQDGVAVWKKEDIPTHLWPVTPLSKMWGIGKRLEEKFNRLGMYKVGDIARQDKAFIEKHFGIMGLEIWNHANGIDETDLSKRNEYVPKERSISNGQTLFADYYYDDALLLIRELCDKVAKRLRDDNATASVVHLSVGFSKQVNGGFSAQHKLNNPTDLSSRLYEVCERIFYEHYDGEPIRRLAVTAGKLGSGDIIQYDLFGEVKADEEERKLFKEIDKLQDKYGASKVLRASSGLEKSTVKKRNKMIGGHNG